MDPNTFPTKGNLILAKNSLALSKQGYELMDKKRNILLRELMSLIEEAKNIQSEIDSTFTAAYQALQRANIRMGIHAVQTIAKSIPQDDTISIKVRSIMGTEIPLVKHETDNNLVPGYSFYESSYSLDKAVMQFNRVKELTIKLSMVENAAYRLASNINKTQKRANALQNITIPHYEELTTSISNALEEKEREEFTRLKVIKRTQQAKKQNR
ncbi:MAG: V-type ATP synthase subunit D [Lachnospiraceae bacterium]